MSKREEKRLWEGLMAHPGWKMLEALADQRVSNIASDVCRPMLQMEEALERNAKSGEMLGIQWVQQLPELHIEMINDDLRRMEATGADDLDDNPAA